MAPAAASSEARVAYAACPLCDVGDSLETMVADCTRHPLYKPGLPGTQRWLKCWSCGHVFVDGYFTSPALTVLLSGAHENQLPGYDVEQQRLLWSQVLDAVGGLRASLGGRWLDVGFGSGALMTTAAEYGYEVAGIDLREQTVQRMRELGFDAQTVELEHYRAEPFDVISMMDVLEHMPFPKRALDRAHALLRPAGLLVLSMPNSESFIWEELTRQGTNPYWAEIEHCHNFSRERLSALLEEHGLQPVRYGVSMRYRACMEIVARKR